MNMQRNKWLCSEVEPRPRQHPLPIQSFFQHDDDDDDECGCDDDHGHDHDDSGVGDDNMLTTAISIVQALHDDDKMSNRIS